MAIQALTEIHTIEDSSDIDLDVNTRKNLYIFEGTVTLNSNLNITTSQEVNDGVLLQVLFNADINTNGNSVTLFGKNITDYLDSQPLSMIVLKRSSWVVGITPNLNGGKIPEGNFPVITNNSLENSSITINGNEVSLGGSTTIDEGAITSVENTDEINFNLTNKTLTANISEISGNKISDNSISKSKLGFSLESITVVDKNLPFEDVNSLDDTAITVETSVSANQHLSLLECYLIASEEAVDIPANTTLEIRGASSLETLAHITTSGSSKTLNAGKIVKMEHVDTAAFNLEPGENFELAVTDGTLNLTLTGDIKLVIVGTLINV